MSQTLRNFLIWLSVGTLLFVVFQRLPGVSSHQSVVVVPYSKFIQDVEEGRVSGVTLNGPHVFGKTTSGQEFATYAPDQSQHVEKLLKKNVFIHAGPAEHEISLLQMILPWLPLIFLAGLTFYSLRQMQSGGNRALGFGRSKARLMDADKNKKITFQDVAGIDEAKEELQEIVEFLKEPAKFQKLGGRIPRGVLLVGPPGTGKTLLAKAIAGEANVPFFSISGSDFVEMFVGVGASRVRDMFEQAQKSAPCIVFIDEIDAVGRHRGIGMGGGNDEREQTLNQLLVEMDGFEENQGVIIVAATNRPDILDPALLRPGRFDRQVTVSNPDVGGREQILRVHMRKIPLAPNVDPKIIARGTPGFSGADLANLVNEAVLMAARFGKLVVSMAEFEKSKDKVMMGAERRSMVMRDEEKKITAYHEAGHAIIAFFTPASDPIHKATIIPRGRALGMVVRLPENDRISVSRMKLVADLRVAMGGRLAEEMIFGPDAITTGASSDIKAATEIARRMITEWGMGKSLGFQTYGPHHEETMMGYPQNRMTSEETARQVDAEIRQLLDACYHEARSLLESKTEQLHNLAQALLERETLVGEDIRILLETGVLPSLESASSRRSSIPISHSLGA